MTSIFPENKEDFTANNGITYSWVENRWRTKSVSGEDYLPLSGGSIAGDLAVTGTISNQGGYFLAGPKDKALRVYDLQGGAVFDAHCDRYGVGVQYYGAVELDAHVTTKAYVDTNLSSYLPLAGGTMTGDLVMNSKKITGLGNATQGGMAVSRNYADERYLQTAAGGQITGYVQFKDDTKLQMGGTYNNNIIDGKEGFTDNSIVATLGYVKHQVANSVGDGSGGGGPTSKYDSNFYCRSGVSGNTLNQGDVMFFNDQLVTTTKPAEIAAIAFCPFDFEWDECAYSGVIRARSGGTTAGFYQVYDYKLMENRMMILYVKAIQTEDGVTLGYESGAPCRFQGVFFD